MSVSAPALLNLHWLLAQTRTTECWHYKALQKGKKTPQNSPFSVWRRLNESVFDKLGSEITLDPSLTVKSIDRYPWGSLRSYRRVRSWARVISAGNGWPKQQWHWVRVERYERVIITYMSMRCSPAAEAKHTKY